MLPFYLDKEIVGSSRGENVSVYVCTNSPSLPMPRRIGVDILIEPISLGWYRSLRVLRRVVKFISNSHASLGQTNNISSKYSSESDLETVFFHYESRVINQSMKPEQIKKYKNMDRVLYYRSRFMDKTQFKVADLDKVPFLDAHEITGNLPVVLLSTVNFNDIKCCRH